MKQPNQLQIIVSSFSRKIAEFDLSTVDYRYMIRVLLIVFAATVLPIFVYMFRYETTAWGDANGQGAVVLDRWTGTVNVCGMGTSKTYCITVYPAQTSYQ